METKPADPEQCINVLEIIGNADRGGMENYLKGFFEHLPSTFKLTCICPYESDFTATLRSMGIQEIYIGRIEDDPYWRSIQLAVEIGKLNRIDVIHAHMPKAHLLAGIAGNLLAKPVVATVHGMDITAHELGIAKAVNSHLITNNQEAYIQAIAMGIPGNRLHVVRNGIDVTKFRQEMDNGESFRKMIGVLPTDMLIGFVGRLDHEKGPDQFLKAAHMVHNKKPNIHFAVVGEGAMSKELNKLCLDLQLSKYVHFVKWQEANWTVYPAFDMLAHTSRSDGTSLVLLEAMACGLPTVAIRVGGVPEIVEHGSTGLLANDWEGVAQNILQLIDKPHLMQKMKISSVKRVHTHFNVKTNTDKVAEIIDHLASKHKNGYYIPPEVLKGKNRNKMLPEIVVK